jgi:hypothetical protein
MLTKNNYIPGYVTTMPSVVSISVEYWTRKWFWVLILIVISVPFWMTDFPPLMDLPGHMARYHVMRELPTSPDLQRYYGFQWGLVGNMGVDLIVYSLKDFLSVERATWAVSLLTVLLTALSIPLLSKTIHGSVQATSLLALPFVYSHFFHWGFLNYALSVALALLALSLWISIEVHRVLFRSLVFMIVGLFVWLCHSMGWAILALSIGVMELQKSINTFGWRPWPVIRQTGCYVWPMSLPLLLMVFWRKDVTLEKTSFYTDQFVAVKFGELAATLRAFNMPLDLLSILVIFLFLYWCIRERRSQFHAPLLWASIALLFAYAIMPSTIMTSAFADTRLVPVIYMLLLIALAVPAATRRFTLILSTVFLLLFVARMVTITQGWADAGRRVTQHLAALNFIGPGSAVLAVVVKKCSNHGWKINYEYPHLTDMSVVRRNAFVNSQWATSGAQLMTIYYNADSKYHTDPSQYAYVADCPPGRMPKVANTLADFPRDRFDYVWIVQREGNIIPATSDMQLLYSDQDTSLYRIIKSERDRHQNR